jgi:hypothetical protein
LAVEVARARLEIEQTHHPMHAGSHRAAKMTVEAGEEERARMAEEAPHDLPSPPRELPQVLLEHEAEMLGQGSVVLLRQLPAVVSRGVLEALAPQLPQQRHRK